jgi:hypothetical protein
MAVASFRSGAGPPHGHGVQATPESHAPVPEDLHSGHAFQLGNTRSQTAQRDVTTGGATRTPKSGSRHYTFLNRGSAGQGFFGLHEGMGIRSADRVPVTGQWHDALWQLQHQDVCRGLHLPRVRSQVLLQRLLPATGCLTYKLFK